MLPVFLGILLTTLLINELLFRFSRRKLSYSTSLEKKTFEIGEEIAVHPVVENLKLMSVPFLRVDEYYDKGFSVEVNSYSLFLMPFQRVRRIYRLQGVRRGVWHIQAASLKIEDLLGFHHSYNEQPLKIPVTILPEKRPLKDVILPYSSLYGPLSVKRWIMDDPLMIRGIREYTGSESQRYVHWPSTLKHDRLMVKQFDFTAEKSALVFLNIESAKPFWKDTDSDAIEEAMVAARSVMEELSCEKIPYGFASNGYNQSGTRRGYYFPPGLAKDNLRKYNEILGKMSTVIAMPLEEGLKAMSRNRNAYEAFILITPKVLPEYIRPLKEFARAFGKTIVISMEGENLDKLPKSMEIYKGVSSHGNTIS